MLPSHLPIASLLAGPALCGRSGSGVTPCRPMLLAVLWPPPPCLQVASISGAADSSKAEKAAQLRLEGRSLVQALEAVERELAPAAP